MTITAITIENFKGIREPVRVELKPITLLFGPNSAGKSTIVQALHYAREIFLENNINPDWTVSGGDSVDLGGFQNFIHNHDLALSFRLRFDFRFSLDQGHNFPYFAEGLAMETEESEHYLNFYWDQTDTAFEPWLEITIRWSSFVNRPFVTSYKTGFGDRLFAEISASNDGKRLELSFLDLESPVFKTKEGDNLAHAYLEQAILNEEGNRLALNIEGTSVIPRAPRGIRFPDISDWHPNGMPDLPIFTEVSEFTGLLNSLLLAPVEYLREGLDRFRYVGPLRKVPRRGYMPALTPSLSQWADGLAAWDLLYEANHVFISRVNDWLESRLEAGYSIEAKDYREIDVTSPLSLAFLQDRYIDEDLDLKNQFTPLPVKRRLILREIHRDIEVSPPDIGVGISQVLPVIVLALKFSWGGIIAIEQPELHIHPALQVALGDLFIEEIHRNKINEGKIFLLETHSEHLMLRFLRRIRETSEQKEQGDNSLTPSELSINFIEQSDTGITCLPIRVDEDGDFIDRWPHGFFAERAGELF